MKVSLRGPVATLCRVKGINGTVRELTAVFDINSEYCTMQQRDAQALGYLGASYRPGIWQKIEPEKAPLVLDYRGVERSILLTLEEVSVGRMAVKSVDTVLIELGLPRLAPFDVVLGRSFLKNFKMTVDLRKGYLSLSK